MRRERSVRHLAVRAPERGSRSNGRDPAGSRTRRNPTPGRSCALYALAAEHGDYATQTMLHWSIDKQVEEEQWCEEAVALLETAGDNRSALLMLDNRYGNWEEGRLTRASSWQQVAVLCRPAEC